MVPMCPMEVAIYQVADVIAVRNHSVAAVVAMHVISGVLVAKVFGRAAVGMVGIDRQHVVVDTAGGHMVEMTVVQVVMVVVVGHELVLTVKAVHMVVYKRHVLLRSPPTSRAWARPTCTRLLTCSSASE